jgi:hypothetical protein
MNIENNYNQTAENMICPECSYGNLATIEKVTSIAYCDSIQLIDGIYEIANWNGESDMIYDESETVGVICECGWEFIGENWFNQLRKENS